MMRSPLTVLTLALVVLAAAPSTASAQRDPNRMTHGPMLGRPSSTSVAVWARTSDPGEFSVHYGTRPPENHGGDLSEHISEPGLTRIEHDNTGVATLNDLEPDTRYHYRIYVNDRPQGEPGTFRTLPDQAGSESEHNPDGLFNFRFQIGSCANQNPLHGIGHDSPTYKHLNQDWADKVHFHIMNGDWLYEELREYPAEAWRLTQGIDELPQVVAAMPTVTGVWENYKLYLTRNHALSTWHRNVPSLFTFDDHELVNDIWGASEAGKRHRRTVFRDIGTYAWNDYLGWANPVESAQRLHVGTAKLTAGSDLLVDRQTNFRQLPLNEMLNLHVHWGTDTAGINDMIYDTDDGEANSYVYDIVEVVDEHTVRLHMPAKADGQVSYSIGQRSYGKFSVSNCDFFLLDTRGDRDMHDVSQRDKPGVSMLGKHQREWLLREMKASDAKFTFLISSVPMMIPHSGAGGFEADEANKEEAWTGFLDEREMLIDAWDEMDKQVFVMTGDLHNSFAIRVTDNVWEFCCGPHNSVNHVPELDESDRPATGRFQFGPRECDIRWSSYVLADLPRLERLYPHFCVVQVNNVFNMPVKQGDKRLVAYPHPQVVFQYYDGWTGELAYAESISLPRE
ncbi:alkaline phosphatase D family protein [Rhodopirellula sp. P2]|uniref:alkaline phosphatase D family protein n=1 Tax=Rhodopirellula sp. P2 TaxID=2127060 RepID=UPI002367F0BA|nr:metallophosphoesterase family protein [Rhodopirellula sp. P2]WDQ18117.1 metallophosphoesterase family protein [Rhodopirellula sp. P2]